MEKREESGRKIRKSEQGLLTVEAVLSLVPFIMVILGIISFINIYMIHNKIQYAMYQVGSELSGYTYFYEALGLRSGDLALKGDIDSQTAPVDTAIEDIGNFMEQLDSMTTSVGNLGSSGVSGVSDIYNQGQSLADSGQSVAGDIQGFVKDPKSLLRGIVYLGVEAGENKAKQLLLGWLSQGMLENYIDVSYLPSGAMNADAYLKKFGVKDGMAGLSYDNSQLFQDADYRMIDIVVEYDIEVYILKLFLKDPTIHVCQRVSIPAWLDGDGVRYTKE